MMMMMKEGIFAGHSSLPPPLHLAWIALASLALALNPLAILPLHSPLLRSLLRAKMAKRELKRQNAS